MPVEVTSASSAARPVVATRRFFLVGFMGAGKTTLGRDVAGRLGLPFYDLDERIAAAAGASVSDVFTSEGEEGFRRRETTELQSLVEMEAGIVATGGGAFTIGENRAIMARSGLSVWLDVPFEALLPRVEHERRPLWRGADEARALAESRRAFYRRADLRLELDHYGPERGADELHRLLIPHLAPRA